jgi:hypothetical protein
MNPKAPIYLSDGDDLNIFKDIRDAISYIEPIDIHYYTGYDSKGRELKLNNNNGIVEIKLANFQKNNPNKLKNILIAYFKNVDNEFYNINIDSLDALVEYSLKYAYYEQKSIIREFFKDFFANFNPFKRK